MSPFLMGLAIAILAGIYAAGRIFLRWIEADDEEEAAPLVFVGPRGRVKIDTDPMATMTGAKRSAGVMIGRRIIDTEDVVVDEVTVEALGKRAFRSSEPHESAHTGWHLRTDGRVGYLGEWQTYGGQGDARHMHEWERRLREDKPSVDHVLFALVYPDGVRLWEGEVATGRIVEMRREAVRRAESRRAAA